MYNSRKFAYIDYLSLLKCVFMLTNADILKYDYLHTLSLALSLSLSLSHTHTHTHTHTYIYIYIYIYNPKLHFRCSLLPLCKLHKIQSRHCQINSVV